MSYHNNPFMSPIAKAYAKEQDKKRKKEQIKKAATVSFEWHEEQVNIFQKELDVSNQTVREKNNKLTDTMNKVDKLEEEIKHLKFALAATVLCLTH
jgi:predicted  nucleic acid-binding Zn-ribbon protein